MKSGVKQLRRYPFKFGEFPFLRALEKNKNNGIDKPYELLEHELILPAKEQKIWIDICAEVERLGLGFFQIKIGGISISREGVGVGNYWMYCLGYSIV